MSPKVTPQNANNTALQHGGGAAAASGLASSVTTPRSHPMVMRTRVGAGTGDGLQPQGPRPAASTGGVGQKRSAEDVASGSEAGSSQRQRVASPGSQGAGQATATVFSAPEAELLKQADKVLVLEYSSTGGGHTARSLDPIKQALKDGTLKKGDCVVLLAPPRWPSDFRGDRVDKLHKYAADIGAAATGVNVIIKQSDKSVTGIYKPGGASDNVAMLKDFVYKPRRDVEAIKLSSSPTHQTRAISPDRFPTGHGESAKAILKGLVDAVGDADKQKITVLGDMAPFLQKAAKALDINNRVEIGNHQGLFLGEARESLGNKDLAYLFKASSGGLPNKLALVEYANDLNVVADLKIALTALDIRPETTQTQARAKAVAHLLEYGVRNDLEEPRDRGFKNGILVGKGVANASDVKAVIFLYVNDYTSSVVSKLRERIADQPETYGKTLFAICGGGGINAANATSERARKADNILQVMYAASADGVSNAGFGTTSEYFYLAKNGSAARLVVAPVENQHEQEANAAQLVEEFKDGGRVVSAQGIEALNEAISQLVSDRTQQQDPNGHLQGDMRSIVDAANKAETGAKHAASLLKSHGSDPMRTNANLAIEAMNDYAEHHAPKQHRRLFKLVVPMLDAVIKGNDLTAVQVRATRKVDGEDISVDDAKALLKSLAAGHAEAKGQFKTLMKLEGEIHPSSVTLAQSLYEVLNEVTSGPVEGRSKAAEVALTRLAEKAIALGW